MLIIFLFTFIELSIFSFFSPVDETTEYVFIIINAIIVSFVINRQYPNYYKFFLLAYILRIVLLLIDYNHIFPVLHSGADSEIFNLNSSINAKNGNYELRGTNYEIFITWLYMLLGNCRLIVQYINILFGIGVVIYLSKIFDEINLNENLKKNALTIAIVFPHLIIFSGILLREAWCEFFIAISLFYFIKWMKYNQIQFIALSIISVLSASWMHSGCIFIAAGYLISFAFYHPELEKSKVSFAAVILLCFLVLSSTIILTSTNIFTERFESFDENKLRQEGVYNYDFEGKSVYLTWINPNSPIQLLLFSPLKMFYFLFSPIPIDWRGGQDIIAFFFDSIFYFYFVYYTIKYHKKLKTGLKKNICRYILISLFFLCFVFGYGTTTAGTAIRHRCKIFPIFLTMYVLSVSEKKKYI
ncbi:MAG: hypothetical protein LBG80_00925 [Bacteroidales bacterium]|jgi:hypothetical protein|nr:hypothetical protein [Bacteroidales bacterium]